MEFKLPDLGEGVAEGEIVRWLVEEGQPIKEDQPMVEVMTDKATVQIPSPTTGTVKQILAKEGQTVRVGTILVVLTSSSDERKSERKQPESPVLQPEQSSEKAQTSIRNSSQQAAQNARQVIATPATRKLARDLGIDIEAIQGTGAGNRITEEDVRKAANSPKQPPQARMVQQQVQSIERQAPAQMKSEQQLQPAQSPTRSEERISLHGIRKRIAEKMMKSTHGTASVTHIEEVDFTDLVALREASKPLAESQKVKLTFLPFVVKATVAALKQFQFFNASIDDEKQEIIVKHYYNIGFAADTPNGLIVPVIRDADKKDLLSIAREIELLSESARNGTIQLRDIQGGTFTITNIGTLGGVISTPIINVPEVAILGIHKIQKRPVVRDDQIVIRQMGFVALTFDHRVVDGADAARFTSRLKQYLENPALIFVESSLG